MNLRRFLAEAAALVGLAVCCALVSNALVGKERRLALPGNYPNATKVARPEARPAPFEGTAAGPATAAPDLPLRAPDASVPATATSPGPAVPLAGATASRGVSPAPVAPTRRPAAQRSPAPTAELLKRFPAHGQPYLEVSGDAAAWLHAGGALFLDARRSKDFSAGHVAGARSFPVWESDVVKERIEGLVAEGRDTALPVVLYCSGGDCEDSHMLAQALFGAGFNNLLVYRDGFPDWVKRGGAVGTGTEP